MDNPAMENAETRGRSLIEKLEFVGHVQKRVGTRLQNLKNKSKEVLPDGKRLGGKSRLTEASIDKLQSYYGNAIRANKNDIVKIRAAVWAVMNKQISVTSNGVFINSNQMGPLSNQVMNKQISVTSNGVFINSNQVGPLSNQVMNEQITVTSNAVTVKTNKVVQMCNQQNTNPNTQPPPANVQITMTSDGTSFQQNNGSGATQVSNSAYVRINVARQESQNTLTFLQAVFVIVQSTVCCSFCLGFYLSVPIPMIVIGALYKDDCPIEPMIPTYLLLTGSLGLLTSLLSLVQGEGKRMSTVDVLLHLSQLFSLIAGSIIVYRVYDDVTYDSANSKEYCHKILYLFAFWLTTCSYIVLGLCCLCGCAACLSEL
ncbi:uncharacterized protein LOC131928791 [Physella acuta]|uniref:uncharacterized protein LOC131928791 n=1 Tax=Physella acuta TaxID=109671 RepID=UPI0027DE33F1|nr:uncharacterized protein LOC131928791 [Physella acuta]